MGYSKDSSATGSGKAVEETTNPATNTQETAQQTFPLPTSHRLWDPHSPLHRNTDQSKTLAEQLAKQLNEAIEKAVQSYRNQEKREGVINGYLTLFRHGSYGKSNADHLKKELSLKSSAEIIDLLSVFFNASDTNFNNHSLAPYILDKLNELLQSLKLKTFWAKKYDSVSWPSIRECLKTYYETPGKNPASSETDSEDKTACPL